MLRKDNAAVRSEHEVVRHHVGYYDFTHQLLEVTGIDARSFLSRMFVGKISKAKVGQAKYTTMLNENGEIIDDVIVFRIKEDTFWVSTLYIKELIAWFDSHRIGENVSYKEITQETTMYAVQGPASRVVLNQILAEAVTELKQFQIVDNKVRPDDINVRIARSGYTGELGYEVYCSPADAKRIEARLDAAGAPYGIRKITTDVIVTSLPREKGFVLMSDLAGTNPLEAGFDWTIDWNKRFVGKAALEEIRNRGVERKLLGFTVDDDAAQIEPGNRVLLNGKDVGSVTMFTYGYTMGKNIGFALVATADAAVGDRVIVQGDGQYPAVLCERTFYDPNNERTKEANITLLEKEATVKHNTPRKDDTKAKKEHEIVRTKVGYYDFTHQVLEVSGIDARSFLDYIFVGSISKAKVGQAKYTTMLNENGEIIDDVIVFRIEEDTYWISTLFIDKLVAWFDAHLTWQDVQYRDISAENTMYAVQGPYSWALLDDMMETTIDGIKPFQIRPNKADGIDVRIARSGYTGELGYEVYCKPEDAAKIESMLEYHGARYGISKITTDVIITSLPREKGFVLMSDLAGTNPLEAGFDWTIDWNKDFIGKTALDEVKKHGAKRALVGFTVDDDLAVVDVGAPVIANDEVAGEVTVYTYGFTVEKNIGFALIDLYKTNVGDKVIIGNGVVATLTKRMFYDPEGLRMRH